MSTTKEHDVNRLFETRANRGSPRGADSVLAIARQMASATEMQPTVAAGRTGRGLLIAATCLVAGGLAVGGTTLLRPDRPVAVETDAAAGDAERPLRGADASPAPSEDSTGQAEFNDLAGEFLTEDGTLRPVAMQGSDYEATFTASGSIVDDRSIDSDYLPHDAPDPVGPVVQWASYVIEPTQGELELMTGGPGDLEDDAESESGDGETVSTERIGTVDVTFVSARTEPFTPLEGVFSDDERARLLAMSDEEAAAFVERRIVDTGGRLNVDFGDGPYHEIPIDGQGPAPVGDDGTAEESTEAATDSVFERADTRWSQYLQPQPAGEAVRAAWHVDGVNFRLQGLGSVDELRTVIRLMTPVSEEEFLEINPDAIGEAQLEAVVDEILDGVPLPGELTAESLAAGIATPAVADDVARQTLAPVVCNWIGRWVDAGGNGAQAAEAQQAVQSVPDWPYVAEYLADDTLLTEQTQQFAEAMATDGELFDEVPVEDYYRSAFGC